MRNQVRQNNFSGRVIRALSLFALALGIGTKVHAQGVAVPGNLGTIVTLSTGSLSIQFEALEITGLSGTTAYVRISTDAAFGGFVSSGTTLQTRDLFLFRSAPGTLGTRVQTNWGTGLPSGLAPNTSYWITVSTDSAFATGVTPGTNISLATATFANQPTSAGSSSGTVVAVTVTTSSFSGLWNAKSNPLSRTTYTVTLSTAPDFSVGVTTNSVFTQETSTLPAAAQYTFSGLTPNRLYFFKVSATNHGGVNTGTGFVDWTWTAPNAPGVAATTFSSATETGLQFNYMSGLAPANTSFFQLFAATGTCTPQTCPLGSVSFSTAPQQSGVTTFSTSNARLSSALSGLTPNTTYAVYVVPVGFGNLGSGVLSDGSLGTGITSSKVVLLGSTATLANQPTMAGGTLGTYVMVTSSRVFAAFTSNGNPSAVTTYTIVASTSSAFTASASPFQISLDTFPTTSNGSLGTGQITSLTPDTTYFFRVRALNRNGVATAWNSMGSTWTAAAQPISAAATTVGSSSFTLNWGANSNPTSVVYHVEVSTDNFLTLANFTGLSGGSKTYSTSILFTSSVTAGVTYQTRVRALGQNNMFSNYTDLPNVVTLGGTTGQTAPTADASSATFVTVTTFTVQPRWINNGKALMYYQSVVSTDSAFTTVNFSTNSISTTTMFGLNFGINQANTLYYFGVTAGTSTTGGNSNFLNLGSTYTLAAVPTGSNLGDANTGGSRVYRTSAAFDWSLNGNPTATQAEVQYSTEPLFLAPVSSVSTSWGSSPRFVATGLLGCTPYYFKVRNINGNSVKTTFDSTMVFTTSNTIPTAPANFTATPLGSNQIKLDWGAAGPDRITGYRLYRTTATNVVDPSTGTTGASNRIAVFSSTITTFTDTLPGATTATYKVTAVHACGDEDPIGAKVIGVATGTLSDLRAAVVAPVSGAQIIGGTSANASTSLTLEAALTAGNALNLNRITFQFRAAGAATWTDIGQVALSPYIVKWDISGFAGGANLTLGQSYELRAVALSVSGSSDTAPSVITFTPVAGGTVGSFAEYTQGAQVTLVQTINQDQTNTLTCSGGNTSMQMQVPSGAYDGPVTITLVPNPTTVPNDPTELKLGPSASAVRVSTFNAVQVTVTGGALRPGATVGIVLGYKDDDNNNVIDGTNVRVDNLTVLRAETSTNSYTNNMMVDTTVNTLTKKVTGRTRATSFFAIFTVASADLTQVRVYPNPFKPNGTNADEGRPFVNNAGNTGIVFDRLPADATIKIYTVSGNLVAEMSQTNGSGTVVWDTRTNAGKNAASGGYLAVISSPGRKSVVKRLAIIR
jgi:hypothetical protein